MIKIISSQKKGPRGHRYVIISLLDNNSFLTIYDYEKTSVTGSIYLYCGTSLYFYFQFVPV